MKKLLLALCAGGFVLSMATTGFAAPYGAAGCGLGSVLFKDQPGATQVVAATTNGISGNQTFGITTGTLNCGEPITISSHEVQKFVVHNMDALAMDIAKGEGETLDAFAELMLVPAAERAEFAGALQQNFSKVFSSSDVVMADVIDNAAAIASMN